MRPSVIWSLILIAFIGGLSAADEKPSRREKLARSHWAYLPPQRPELPAVSRPEWIRNPIDALILARLDAAGLAPSAEADRARLIRRVSLDLIGLPPTIEQVDAFLRDERPDAYERVVEELLASPHYGERWARPWLDLARYADSNGFQRDGFRDVWPYRDWVIQALNDDLPFDRFTIEQIAGDLLPSPTVEQRIATGFHRGPTVNVEAGSDQEQNRVNAVIDRVNTTGTVWLGTTIGCAQCHDHKYDPFTQREYYRLFAFFNNTAMETAFRSAGDTAAVDFTGPTMELPVPPEVAPKLNELTAKRLSLDERLTVLREEMVGEQAVWEAAQLADPQSLELLPARIRKILELPSDERTEEQQKQLTEHYLSVLPDIRECQEEIVRVEKQLDKIRPPKTLVMVELDSPRTTSIMLRGLLENPGEEVTPGVPEILHSWREELPPNRLGLARWLVDPRNPLVGRVTVNRWWAEFFGRGLVETPEDIGTQSPRPTHPELLDWLATEFVKEGWSMKHIHRLIVLSATYRQSSVVTPELLERDPDNRLYARGPRFRLSAETIRDNALAISGLLSPKVGGPPVYPPQPDGLWKVIGKVDNNYYTSSGEDRYRRGIYTIWRRSAPYPSFTTFDAPDRTNCIVQRPRTNTPLQALTLMNDPVYVDMTRAFAKRIVDEAESLDVRARAERAFRLALARMPSPVELAQLEAVYLRERARFENDIAAARTTIGNKHLSDEEARELAAWFYVAAILLNLDETITRG